VGTTTNDYSLGYSNLFDEFSIVIVSEPSGKFREAAENELVFALGMTKDEVCELPVFVSRKTWANNFDYEEVGLSFCPGSVELD
jgi:hypothetical protein